MDNRFTKILQNIFLDQQVDFTRIALKNEVDLQVRFEKNRL